MKWRLTGGADPLGEREILNQGAVSERNAPNRAQFPAKYVETLCNAKESCALRAASMLREAAFFLKNSPEKAALKGEFFLKPLAGGARFSAFKDRRITSQNVRAGESRSSAPVQAPGFSNEP